MSPDDPAPAAIVSRLATLARSPATIPPAGSEQAIHDAELAIAKGVARIQLLETDLRESREIAAEWLARGTEAAARALALRIQHGDEEAQRWEEVAEIARERNRRYRAAVQLARTEITASKRSIAELRGGLKAMRDRWGRKAHRSVSPRDVPGR